MNLIRIILILSSVFLLQGCYIQRYFDIKKEYEAYQKASYKTRKTNAQLKAQRQQKLDSISMVARKSAILRLNMLTNDSLSEACTMKIREALGAECWDDSVKTAAHTATKIRYMSENEKDVLYWLNLARMKPDLFAELYLDPFVKLHNYEDWICCGEGGWGMQSNVTYLNTLYLQMATMKSLPALQPDEDCYRSAECHATESGKTGYVGHARVNCKSYFSGECCDYGNSKGLDVILNLLIDNGVPSLGHRKICLGDYRIAGISQKPHKYYRFNTVLDFK